MWAQDKRSPALAGETRWSVLIPVDAQGKPVGELPLAYVSPELETLLRKSAAKPEVPPWLLTAARYSADMAVIGGPVVRAEFDVAVLSQQGPLPVTLPLTRVNLSGDDAALQRVLAAEDRPASQVVSVHPMRAPWWIIPFAGCLTIEWWLRRREGLR